MFLSLLQEVFFAVKLVVASDFEMEVTFGGLVEVIKFPSIRLSDSSTLIVNGVLSFTCSDTGVEFKLGNRTLLISSKSCSCTSSVKIGLDKFSSLCGCFPRKNNLDMKYKRN